MKTIKTLSILIIGAAIIFSCKKKKEDPAPAPAATTTTGNPPQIDKLAAKVNGISWSMIANENISGTFIAGGQGNYIFGGQSSFDSPNTSISFGFKDSVGTFTLIKYGTFNASYRDENNVYYRALTGTLAISEMDTTGASNSIIKKLKGTFSFNTDTVGGKSFQVTDGVIDYEK